MNYERRQKYNSNRNNNVKSDTKLNVVFDLVSLDLMCSYIVTDNRNIRRSHLINMRNLVDILDLSLYENDTEKMKRIDFIKRGLDARLIEGLKQVHMIIKHINGGIMDKSVIDADSFKPMSNDELEWLGKTVSETLKYSYIYNDVDALMNLCSRFKSQDYALRGEIVREFETLISQMQAKFRRSRMETSSEMMFSLRKGVFEESIKDFHEQLMNPANKLICGMQGLNEMTGGGFESGRTYMLFGLSGEGKSTTLLNLVYQIKKYNKFFIPKDTTKVPCIVLLTMENTVRESVVRLFNISSAPDNITNYSADEVIDILRRDGELYLSDESPIDIIIKYVPDSSVDTGYLYTLTEDLEDDGYEVICMIQDYVKRIRPVNRIGDIRIDLGAVVNEFKTFATLKDIPVISVSQLNRDATKHIDEGRKTNKADLLRLLGRSNIGESMLMLENVDCAFMIAPEYDQNGFKFLGMQRIKIRYFGGDRDHIYQPYAVDNDIKLIEDVNSLIPLFRSTMRLDSDDNGFDNGIKQSQYHTNNIKDLNQEMKFRIDPDDDFNFFSNNIINIDTVKHEYRRVVEFPIL